MTDNYSKVLELVAKVAQLEDTIRQVQAYHLQTMLTIAVAAGGEIRLSEWDWRRTKGKTLATFVDPQTGDRVFVAKGAEEDPVLNN